MIGDHPRQDVVTCFVSLCMRKGQRVPVAKEVSHPDRIRGGAKIGRMPACVGRDEKLHKGRGERGRVNLAGRRQSCSQVFLQTREKNSMITSSLEEGAISARMVPWKSGATRGAAAFLSRKECHIEEQ